jgi:hypothetical protein
VGSLVAGDRNVDSKATDWRNRVTQNCVKNPIVGWTQVKRSIATFAAAIALSATLGGCLVTSQQPLFPEATAVAVFGNGGRYTYYEKDGDRYKSVATVELRRHEGGYDYIANGAVVPVTLHPMGQGIFIVQAKGENSGYAYARVRMSNGAAFVQLPDCDKQDINQLTALGVVRRDDNVFEGCVLDGVRDVKTLLAIDFGETLGKFEPE